MGFERRERRLRSDQRAGLRISTADAQLDVRAEVEEHVACHLDARIRVDRRLKFPVDVVVAAQPEVAVEFRAQSRDDSDRLGRFAAHPDGAGGVGGEDHRHRACHEPDRDLGEIELATGTGLDRRCRFQFRLDAELAVERCADRHVLAEDLGLRERGMEVTERIQVADDVEIAGDDAVTGDDAAGCGDSRIAAPIPGRPAGSEPAAPRNWAH